MLNTVPVSAKARSPRAIVRLGGQAIAGWLSWAATTNSFYEADTFRASFATSKLPTAFSEQWFSQQTEIFCEILAGEPSNPAQPNAGELTSLIYGRVDDIELALTKAEISITGRDLTAAFIDKKLDQQYQNKTSSQVAQLLAQSHGLSSNVTPTTAKIGTYYNNDQVVLAASRSEWDLLCWLAREEGYVVYVAGQTLNFIPDPTSTSNPYVIQWRPPSKTQPVASANVTELAFSRSCTVANGISVTVRSPKGFLQKGAIVQSYPTNAKAIKAGASSPFGGVQTYYFNLPAGKSAVQVQQYAQMKYHEIIAHAMKLSARLPADELLTITTPIRVEGTGTDFDQLYYPRSITRSMDLDAGYVMDVEAQNTTPALEQAASPLS